MNYQVLARIRDWDGLPPSVPASARATLANLAAHGNSDHEAWPSLARVASGLGRSVRQIERDLDALLTAGLLRRVRAANTPGAEHRTARYRLGPALLPGVEVTGANNIAPTDAPALRVVPRARATTAKPRGDAEPPRFTELWAAYPNGKERKDALREFRKLAPDDALFAEILNHVKRRALTHDWTKEGGRWVPSLRKFLHGERWKDAIADGLPAQTARELPDATAWRRGCKHVPPCGSVFEHEARTEAQSVSA